MTDTNSPTPWFAEKARTLVHIASGSRTTGTPVCSLPVEREADAALIVEAVNSHARLLADRAIFRERIAELFAQREELVGALKLARMSLVEQTAKGRRETADHLTALLARLGG